MKTLSAIIIFFICTSINVKEDSEVKIPATNSKAKEKAAYDLLKIQYNRERVDYSKTVVKLVETGEKLNDKIR